jgi:hypothetical protein
MPDHLYRRGKTWWVIVQVNGKRYRKSLKTTLLTEAKVRRNKWIELLKQEAFYQEIGIRSEGAHHPVQCPILPGSTEHHPAVTNRAKSLEMENRRLKELLAEAMVKNQALKALLSR